MLPDESEDGNDVGQHGFGRHFGSDIDDVEGISIALPRGRRRTNALNDDFHVDLGRNEAGESGLVLGAELGQDGADGGEAQVARVG